MPRKIDPGNPVDRLLADEEARDHALAKARGQRALDITNMVLGALDGHGLLRDQEQAKIVIWSAVCDAIFPYDAAIDIPKLGK